MKEPRKEWIHTAIKYNNCGAKDNCGICGQQVRPWVPLQLFLHDSFEVVCDQCGQKYAPELQVLLKIFYLTKGPADLFRGKAKELTALNALCNFLEKVHASERA